MPTRSERANAAVRPQTRTTREPTSSRPTTVAPEEKGWQPKQAVRQVKAAASSAVRELRRQAAAVAQEAKQVAAERGLFRVGMDNANPTSNADVTAYVKDKKAALAHFDARLTEAKAYLKTQGLEGEVVGKLVTADIVNVAGMDPVEHAEWQFFLVPKKPGETWKTDENGMLQNGESKTPPPGLLDENKLTAWVEQRGAKSEGSPFLRSADNPLFLGRLNYGTAGAGMYTKVPDYAEVGGHAYNTRSVEGLALTTPAKVRAAITAMYTKQPGAYGTNGVCHQGAVLVADALGLDPVKNAARHVDSLWATRLKFGRAGRALPGDVDP